MGKRNDDSDQGSESAYESDHSYEFHMGHIDYTKQSHPKKKPVKYLNSVVKIQSLARMFLVRL